jgi:DNA invertase Pin-like site-specific DNA recombinase
LGGVPPVLDQRERSSSELRPLSLLPSCPAPPMKITTLRRPFPRTTLRVLAPHAAGVAELTVYARPRKASDRGIFLRVGETYRPTPSRILHDRVGSDTSEGMHPSIVAYVRVSTREQHRSGLSLEAQEEAIRRMARDQGMRVLRVFVEQDSGKRDDRPVLTEALAFAKRRGATLAVAKLDRLSRSVEKVAATLNGPVAVKVAACPEATKLELHLRATIAEEEARLISERTSEALRRASARGTKLGWAQPARRRGRTQDGRTMREVQTEAAQKGGEARRTKAAEARAELLAEAAPVVRAHHGEPLRKIAAALEAAGVVTTRGNTAWTATGVARLLDHLSVAG